ncbi:MAG: citrate transporter [Peptococcaceae bacterium]|nr:citrate transporter [Peptococcaceae bacterium]
MKEKIIYCLQRERILCVAFVLALVSMLFVRPDFTYITYIDFRMLAILFCLMGVMAGLKDIGFFQWVAELLLSKVQKVWQLVLGLVLLCFFSAMLITNDVALITFVPFTFTIFALIGSQIKKQLLIPIVVLQTIAANLGSMLTPIGNPQNLYLYSKSGISLCSFVVLMLPYTLFALLLTVIWCFALLKMYPTKLACFIEERRKISGTRGQLFIYAILFGLVLLTVARLIPYGITLGITIIGLLIVNKRIFLQLDYSLLLTFIGFFIFIGNMGRLPAFHQFLQQVVCDHELLVAVTASQIISNVPAALLLSGFTDNYTDLLIGVNLGGLGTLIASMASLISYKLVVREANELKSAYFRYFTAANICFLLLLLLFTVVYR